MMQPNVIRATDVHRRSRTDAFNAFQRLTEFVKYLNRTENVLFPDVIRITGEHQDVQVDVAMQYNDGYSNPGRHSGESVWSPTS